MERTKNVSLGALLMIMSMEYIESFVALSLFLILFVGWFLVRSGILVAIMSRV